MTHEDRMTPAARERVGRMAAAARGGRMARREFIAMASVMGASAAGAYGMLGLAAPARAQEGGTPGGVLRIGMKVMPIDDPRLYDWPEKANVARQFCETLVRWEPDFSFSGLLLESWEVSDDARVYTLKLRPGVTWNSGDEFVAEDVMYNFERWCDQGVEGNSMASRLTSMIDAETGRMAEGVMEKVDDLTVRLTLPVPDITIIPGISDYPALIVHREFDAMGADLAANPIGTGPFVLDSIEIGSRASVSRRPADGPGGGWWGGDVYLDGVEFIDFGADQATLLAAFDAEEIDLNDESNGEFVFALDALGLVRAEKVTGATMVARMNTQFPPYDDQRVRNAVQLAVENAVVLELGFSGLGLVAENHHVGPMHPEYAELPAVEHDPARAMALMEEAGAVDAEMELISIDEDWLRISADAIGAQLRDAGMNVTRTLLPGSTFWNDWTKYPFSTTSWGARPLGVQLYALAYRTGEAWNESAHSNPEFDAKLAEALGVFDPDERRVLMADLERMLQESGVIVQPYWNNYYSHHTAAVKGYEKHQTREMQLEQVWLEQ